MKNGFTYTQRRQMKFRQLNFVSSQRKNSWAHNFKQIEYQVLVTHYTSTVKTINVFQ